MNMKAHYQTDLKTENDTVIRGVIYLSDLVPGEKYLERLSLLSEEEKKANLTELKRLKKNLLSTLEWPLQIFILTKNIE